MQEDTYEGFGGIKGKEVVLADIVEWLDLHTATRA